MGGLSKHQLYLMQSYWLQLLVHIPFLEKVRYDLSHGVRPVPS